MSDTAKSYFEKNKFVLLKGFISKETANLLYNHTKNSANKLGVLMEEKHMYPHYDEFLKNDVFGTFIDGQVNGAYSMYGDLIMDTLLNMNIEKISKTIGVDLIPTYTYYRLYFEGNELKKHIDRESCEISGTMCLGYDVSNVDKNKYPDYSWPMYIKTVEGNEVPIKMYPGDLLMYRGCDVQHWREPFPGVNHSQLFIHTTRSENTSLKNDTRPALGLPPEFNILEDRHPYNKK
jgi:hypothetical protein